MSELSFLKKIKNNAFTPNWFNLMKNKYFIFGVIVCACIIACTIFSISVYSAGSDKNILMADNQQIAKVKNENQVQETIQKLTADLSNETGLQVLGCMTKLSYNIKEGDHGNPLTDEELYKLLKDKLNWKVNCWAININGVPTLYLANKDDAQRAVNEIKSYYVPEKDEIEIESTEIIDDIKIVEAEGDLNNIKSYEESVEALAKGLEKIVKHEIKKGDSLWTIARANDMTVAQLKDINPQLKGDLLKPGQDLNLVKSEPLLDVVTTMTTTQEEKIRYKTIYKEDNSLWRGQYRVEQYGSNGTREVTYRIVKTNDEETNRETLIEKILTEPVTQIVKQGTKVIMASRGDGGNGRLGWPLRGRLTSYYGWRGREFHTGLDIDGVTGDPIYAAESGKVIFAGRMGNYGKLVVIDHGNGLSTRYGHLNKILVKVGQKVSRGDPVGQCGSTGRSSGSHLHFEVRINGQHKNPLNYIER